MIRGLVFGALASADNVEAVDLGPFNQFTDQSRLVAIGEGVNEASGSCTLGQEGTSQDVCFDINHDQVAPVFDGLKSVVDACERIASGFDQNVQSIRPDEGIAVIGEMGGAGLEGVIEVGCGKLFGWPLSTREGFTRPVQG